MLRAPARNLPKMFETLEAYGVQIVEFVKANQGWAPLVVFLLAFGELLAFISLLLPAWLALITIGTLHHGGRAEFLADLGRRLARRRASATGCPTGSARSSNTPCSTSGRCRGIRI